MKKIVVLLMCCATVCANTPSLMKMPRFFNHSWLGLNIGVKNTDFTAADFQSGFDFSTKDDTLVAMAVNIGHYITPNWAWSLSLMRGVHSNKFSDPDPEAVAGMDISSETGSVSETLLALSILPMLHLPNDVDVYAQAGVGMISRDGFSLQGIPVVSDANIVTGVLGAGVIYGLHYDWQLVFSALYALPVDSEQQPGIFYAAIGMNYLLVEDKKTVPQKSDAIFPLNFIEISYVNDDWFYIDAAPYFTPPTGIPIFFDGSIKVAQGLELIYERNFFHTARYFSLEWGAAIAAWQTCDLQQDFYTVSIFPELKWWLWRSPRADFYFSYSLAGPSYISNRYLDDQDAGSHFTFQDFLGFGAFLGQDKQISVSLKIVHYSNGNLLPNNPGVDVPVMLGIALRFS